MTGREMGLDGRLEHLATLVEEIDVEVPREADLTEEARALWPDARRVRDAVARTQGLKGPIALTETKRGRWTAVDSAGRILIRDEERERLYLGLWTSAVAIVLIMCLSWGIHLAEEGMSYPQVPFLGACALALLVGALCWVGTGPAAWTLGRRLFGIQAWNPGRLDHPSVQEMIDNLNTAAESAIREARTGAKAKRARAEIATRRTDEIGSLPGVGDSVLGRVDEVEMLGSVEALRNL